MRGEFAEEVGDDMKRESDKFKRGDKVTVNGGYPGVIDRKYSERMYEVRLERGGVCVDQCDIVAIDEKTYWDLVLK